MDPRTHDRFPLESRISLIIDGILSSSDATIMEPMLLNFSGNNKYSISDLNLASIYDEEFGEFLFEYTRETASSLDSEISIVLFPGIYSPDDDSFRIVDFIDFKTEIPSSPLYIAMLDDGKDFQTQLYRIHGIPRKSMLSEYCPGSKVTASFMDVLIDHWGVDEEIGAGMFHRKRSEDEPGYDPDFDTEWSDLLEVMPTFQ